jgi:hypothetical protein
LHVSCWSALDSNYLFRAQLVMIIKAI